MDPIATAVQVLEQFISGEVAEANALSQLLHLHQANDKCVVAALAEKTNTVVANADSGTAAAARAGQVLVAVAKHLDANPGDTEGSAAAGKAKAAAKAAAPSAKAPAPRSVSRQLLEHALILTGGQHRAAKDTAIRAQGCVLVADLAFAAPGHQKVVEKLLEFSVDRVPSIRERAVRGLGFAMSTLAVEQALCTRCNDPFMAVRTSAVRSLRITVGSAPVLSRRVDDVEACVRAQLFRTLAKDPAAGKHFGPTAFARLCAGLTDRAAAVRAAAGQAVDAWHKHFGGAIAVLARCDLQGDDALADAVAGALACRYKEEALAAVRAVLEGSGPAVADGVEAVSAALLARHAIMQLPEADRDELVEVPQVLQRTTETLGTAGVRAHGALVLRQLLLVVAASDFCDEAIRRRAERLSEAVLQRAPLTPATNSTSSGLTIPDLGILIMRKCAGLGRGFQPRSGKQQTLEAQCSVRAVLLVSDLCKPLQGTAEAGGVDEEDGEGQFATRLSNRLEILNDAIEERMQKRRDLTASKKAAIANEEFIQAQRIKEATKKNDAELAQLEKEHTLLKAERDNILLRVLAILRAVLRWSGSDLSKDPALHGTLERIMRPVVSLPALSEDVEIAALSAICTFCVRHANTAQNHWSLFLELLRACRPENQPHDMSSKGLHHLLLRSSVVATALADCSLVHSGAFDGLDRDEVMSAAHALGAVPFFARHIAVEPLCRWLMGLGHVFFEEHLREPVLEIQWALGWMLVEAFKQTANDLDEGDLEDEQKPPRAVATPATASHAAAAAKASRARGTSWVQRPAAEPQQPEAGKAAEEEDEDPVVAMATASKLMQFFGLLPKMPGKHSAPMLSLAVESIAETGLWRRAVLLPHMVGMSKLPRWRRGFSWPQLFGFAHERLAADMRFRLWRCSLQLCIMDPALAQYAEVPFALVQVMKDAPAGAAGLVREAVALGADASALSPLVSRLPPSDTGKDTTGLLLSRDAAQAAERERRAALAELGINCDAWAPAHIETPDIVPTHHRIKLAKGENSLKGGGIAVKKRGQEAIVPPSMLQAPLQAAPGARSQAAAAEAAKLAAAEEGAKRRRVAGKTKDTGLSLPLANADVD